MNTLNADSKVYLPRHDRTAWLKGGSALCKMPARIPYKKPWRLILLGAPGVGKGTQAELLHQQLGACHLSTGDIFRDAKCACESELSFASREALNCMRSGALVPDTTVLGLITERLRCLRCPGGFLLDGFPRTVAQAEALEKILQAENVPLDAVINYDLPLEKIIVRLAGRRTCSGCKAVYHIATRPSKTEGICDHCGGKLFQREDDRPESAQVRMAAYETSTHPLIDFYARRNLLRNVPALGRPEDVFQFTRRHVLDI